MAFLTENFTARLPSSMKDSGLLRKGCPLLNHGAILAWRGGRAIGPLAERPDGKVPGSWRLPPVEVRKMLEIETVTSLVVADMRQPWELEAARISGSGNIPLGGVECKVGDLNRSAAVILYCRTDVRASRAWPKFRRRGFERVFILNGGPIKWFDLRGPGETPRLLPWQIGKGCES